MKKNKKMKEERINARLPEFLARHVYEVCEEQKRYDSASEYIRDLIRRDYEKMEQEKIIKLNARLEPLLNRPLSEGIEVDSEASIQEFKERCRAKRKAL